jgi:small conductance mechanosensitive channel
VSIVPESIKNYFANALPTVLSFLIQVVIAVVVLLVGLKLINALVKMLRKSMDKGHLETGVVTFLCSLLKYALYFVLVMLILAQFGVTTGSVVAVLGSAGLTAGLALQGSLSNFAGGVLILLLKPFVVGDYIVDHSGNQEGTVYEITIFYTKLLTVDNRMVLIPNGSLSNSSITNVSRMEKRRVDLTVGVAYESDLSKVKQVLSDLAKEDPAVLKEEPVDVFVSNLGDSSIEMGLRVWVKNADYWTTKWRLTENIKNAFDAHEISIPFPQLDVKMK